MTQHRDDHLRIALTEATARLIKEPRPFITLFERGDFCVELYAPLGTDKQQPHDQDEAYIIASGTVRSVAVTSAFRSGKAISYSPPPGFHTGSRDSPKTFRPG